MKTIVAKVERTRLFFGEALTNGIEYINTYLNLTLPHWGFSGPMETNDGTNNANEHNMVKNSYWQETDQLVICKRGRRIELGTTKKLQETRAGLELANSAFHVRRPNHSATLPPSNDMLASFECIWHLNIHFISFSRRVSVLEPMPYMRLQVATIFVCEGYCVPA